MKKSFYLSLFLSVISILAALVLSLTNNLTKNTIKQAALDKQQQNLQSIFSKKTEYKEEKKTDKSNIESIFTASENNKLIGYVYTVNAKGYAGKIKYIIAIDTNGKYIAFSPLSHNETPGFGAKMSDEAFKKQFSEKTITEDIDGISGATITTNGLLESLDEVLQHYEKNYQ